MKNLRLTRNPALSSPSASKSTPFRSPASPYRCGGFGALLVIASLVLPCRAADSSPPEQPGEQQAAETEADQQQRFAEFEQQMSGVKLVGHFTVLGKETDSLPKEEYTINRVTKMPQGDYWLFNARIHYGQQDLTLPLPLQVKWADDTPVITLSDLTIPALGTFSARVVIYNQKYAGTWTHGKAGGHLFGTLEKLETKEPSREQQQP